MLVEQILPLLTRNVPRSVYPSGCEDAGELIQDAAATAAELVEAVERAGKKPVPSAIARYSILRLKSGRRSYSSSQTDVLSPYAQRAQGFSVTSMDAPVNAPADDDGGELTFGDMLACRRDDPAVEACRRVDWDMFLGHHGERAAILLHDTAAGVPATETAKRLKVSSPRICQLKDALATRIKSEMADDILLEAMAEPVWRRDLRAHREKAAFENQQPRRKAA
jgi:hypothetical protein